MSASIILVLTGSAKMKLMATSANAIQAFLDKTVTLRVRLKIAIINLWMTNVTISETPMQIMTLKNNFVRLYFLEMDDFWNRKIYRH